MLRTLCLLELSGHFWSGWDQRAREAFVELQDARPLQPSQYFLLHPKRWCFSSWWSWKGSSTPFREE